MVVGGHAWAWQGACMVRGHEWQGVCGGVCMAGGMCGKRDGHFSRRTSTHPTGMHSCLKIGSCQRHILEGKGNEGHTCEGFLTLFKKLSSSKEDFLCGEFHWLCYCS